MWGGVGTLSSGWTGMRTYRVRVGRGYRDGGKMGVGEERGEGEGEENPLV